NMVYEIPFKFENSIANTVLGHWTMSGIWTWQTGSPYSIFGFTDSAGTALGQRAGFLGGDLSRRSSGQQTQTGPDASLFVTPCPLDNPQCLSAAELAALRASGHNVHSLIPTQGSTGRNAFYGPSYNNVDFSLIKKFPF